MISELYLKNAYYKAKEPAQPAEMPYSAYIGRYTHSGAAQKKRTTELTEPSSQVPPLASHASQLHPRTKLSPAHYQFFYNFNSGLPGYSLWTRWAVSSTPLQVHF